MQIYKKVADILSYSNVEIYVYSIFTTQLQQTFPYECNRSS